MEPSVNRPMFDIRRGSPAAAWMGHTRVMTSIITHLHDKYCDDVTWRMVNRTSTEHRQAKNSITWVR